MNKVYTVDDTVKSLNKMFGVSIKGNKINVADNANIGSKSWGKISFLEKNGYTVVKVKAIDKPFKSREDNDGEERRTKRHNKVNIVPKVKIHLSKTK